MQYSTYAPQTYANDPYFLNHYCDAIYGHPDVGCGYYDSGVSLGYGQYGVLAEAGQHQVVPHGGVTMSGAEDWGYTDYYGAASEYAAVPYAMPELPYPGLPIMVAQEQTELAPAPRVEEVSQTPIREQVGLVKSLPEVHHPVSLPPSSGSLDLPAQGPNTVTSLQKIWSKKAPGSVHKCSRCPRNYKRLSSLKNHEASHSGYRPFICMICSKNFAQQANLRAHQRTHTGERPYRCDMCPRRFSQSSSLVTHRRTHTGEKPYVCVSCDKSFADSSTLTKHLRTHTGEKPYRCHRCPQSFSQSGNLNRHKRIHRANPRF